MCLKLGYSWADERNQIPDGQSYNRPATERNGSHGARISTQVYYNLSNFVRFWYGPFPLFVVILHNFCIWLRTTLMSSDITFHYDCAEKEVLKIIVLQQYSYCLFLAVTEQLLAHLSWKHKLAFLNKICLLSVGIGIVVNFSRFHHFLLQNPWADFNQTWHKALLGEGVSSLFKKEGLNPL